MKCRILDTGSASAAENMRCDAYLLDQLAHDGQPVLHWYGWQLPSLTYGYFIRPEMFLDMQAVEQLGVDHAKRPTGGGLLFHTADLTFSLLVPAGHPAYSINTLDNYAFVNQCVRRAISAFLSQREVNTELLSETPISTQSACASFCMAQPTRYDVMIEGRKVGGAAQRRTKHGYLHQGSICLMMTDSDLLQSVLLESQEIANAMDANSFPLLGVERPSCHEIDEAKRALKSALQKEFNAALHTT